MATIPTIAPGYVDDTDGWHGTTYNRIAEQVPELDDTRAPYVYSRMRTDPQLTAVVQAVTLPILRATWAVDPSGCRDVVAQRVADDLGLPLLGQDQQGAARRRGVQWQRHLANSLRGRMVFGFYPYALQADDDGAVTRLAGLYERPPWTIADITTDDKTGALVSATQDTANLVGGRRPPPMPASSLLWYVREQEGTNWRGRSLLRAAYGPWLLKQEMLRTHAISNRRHGAGHLTLVPNAGVNPTDAQQAAAAAMAQAARAGDQAGGAAPPGYSWQLAGLIGSVPDTLAFIRYLDQQMSRMALAGMLDLGETPNGSRALGAEFVDLFMLTLQAEGSDHAATVTSDVAVRIVDWNYGEDEPAPQIVCTDVGSDTAVTAEAIAALLQSGALSADPGLEASLRSRYSLPQRTTPVPVPTARDLTTAAARGGRGNLPVRAAAGTLRRELTDVEARAATDFVAVQQEWADAVDDLLDDWSAITDEQRAAIRAQVLAAVEAGDITSLAQMTLDTAAAAELLYERMADTSETAATRMSSEAQSQGVTALAGTPDQSRLAQIAGTTAALLAGGLVASAARKALQVWTPGATAATVADAVDAHLSSLTDASLRDSLGPALTTAQNEGRLSTLAGAPKATYVASEVLDAATCQACSAEDGHTFGSLDQASAAYANGGYVECQGGARCRGILIALWDDA